MKEQESKERYCRYEAHYNKGFKVHRRNCAIDHAKIKRGVHHKKETQHSPGIERNKNNLKETPLSLSLHDVECTR
jgi:hypothetical protein